MLEKQDTIILGYPTQFSNAPFMVRDFIKRNAFLWKGRKVFCVNTMGLFSDDGTGCRTNQAEKISSRRVIIHSTYQGIVWAKTLVLS